MSDWQDEARALVACGWFEWREGMRISHNKDEHSDPFTVMMVDGAEVSRGSGWTNPKAWAWPGYVDIRHAGTQGVLLAVLAEKVGGDLAQAAVDVLAVLGSRVAYIVGSEEWGIALSRALRAAHGGE